jgi:hypothetical protein
MNSKLKKWQHAALSAAILLVLSAVVYVLFIEPAVSGRVEFYNRLDQLQFQYQKLSNAIDKTDALRTEIIALKQDKPDQSGFLEEKVETLAAADLQNRIKNLVSSFDGNLISTQVIQNQEDTIFPEITIKVHMRGDIETLQKLLYELRSSQPVLLVDNLLIQARNVNRRRRIQQNADQLEIRFDITGFIYRT